MNETDPVDLSRVRRLAKSGAARSIRLAAGLTLSEIAEAVGCSISVVWRWEHGERAPKGQRALRYAALLQRLLQEGRANG